jgi:hypothetical protein
VTPVHSLWSYQQHECTGHIGGGHGLITGGGHGLITGGGQIGIGMQIGGSLMIGQQVTTTGRHGRLQADASETPANIATATINASNVFMVVPFRFFPIFLCLYDGLQWPPRTRA